LRDRLAHQLGDRRGEGGQVRLDADRMQDQSLDNGLGIAHAVADRLTPIERGGGDGNHVARDTRIGGAKAHVDAVAFHDVEQVARELLIGKEPVELTQLGIDRLLTGAHATLRP
jgi:hypothetical protein